MEKEELQKIIKQFDEEELISQGVFGIIQYGGGPDESFIRANKEGLELFALRLLQSATEVENVLSDPNKDTIQFEWQEDWVDENSDTCIIYIEPIADKQKLSPEPEYKPTTTDKLMPFGCGLVAIILVISLVVGLVTVFNWIF